MSMTVAERLGAVGAANALELRGVSRLFGALAALTDVTLSIRPGERRGVLGSNGEKRSRVPVAYVISFASAGNPKSARNSARGRSPSRRNSTSKRGQPVINTCSSRR